MIRPDYAGGSIVNLMRSLADACGSVEPLPYLPLRAEKVGLPETAKHIVLLVIDGLGHRHLSRRGRGGALQRHLRAQLTSVFPSTTASAVTTYLSGLAPQQHALTGWHMHFSELDAVAAVLPLKPRGPGRFEAPDRLPQRLFGHRPFTARIARRSVMISPQSIASSPFNRYHAGPAQVLAYKTLAELFARIQEAVRQADAPSYIYAYYPDLDALAHEHGIASPQTDACLAALDAAFGRLLAALAGSNCLVLASADHGFIDSPPERQLDLAQLPQLADTLSRPLCGERRVVYCYVRDGQARRFEAAAGDCLDGRAEVFPAREFIEAGWFGPGRPDPRLASRIGDYVLLMREDWTLKDQLPGEKQHPQIGVHGGVSADEMLVPLIVADCRA